MITPVRFRTGEVDVEVMQIIDDLKNHRAIYSWTTDNGGGVTLSMANSWIEVMTTLGIRRADLGDWIVRLGYGRFHVLDPDAFEVIYGEAYRASLPVAEAKEV